MHISQSNPSMLDQTVLNSAMTSPLDPSSGCHLGDIVALRLEPSILPHSLHQRPLLFLSIDKWRWGLFLLGVDLGFQLESVERSPRKRRQSRREEESTWPEIPQVWLQNKGLKLKVFYYWGFKANKLLFNDKLMFTLHVAGAVLM